MPNVLNIYCRYTISTVNPMLVLNVLAYSSTLFRSCASTLASGEMAPAPGPRAMAACSAVAWYSPQGAAPRKNGTGRVQLEYCTQIHCIIIWGARIQGGLHIFSYTPWNRIAKFLNYCFMRFAIPPLRFIFLWCDPLLSYGMKSGFAEKQLRNFIFFRATLWNSALQKKQLFRL